MAFLKPPKNKDSLSNVLMVSVFLCLACSAVVSVAAVSLREMQQANVKLAKQRDRLIAAGFKEQVDGKSGKEIGALYAERIREQWIDLETGEPTTAPAEDAKEYDFEAAPGDNSISTLIDAKYGVPGRRPKVAPIYQVLAADGTTVDKIVLPMSGKGLWSTLRAYVALDVNFNEANAKERFPIAGVTFYEQAETAGLGAEVENADWQKGWEGRFAFR
ncbi:MAG: hypothetical protein AAF907_00820, partial [Planctomycetota bacterium]